MRALVTKETAIPSSLAGSPKRTIPLDELAAELGVPVDRLAPLIEHHYLKESGIGVVQRPAASAMEWLRTMFMPLPMRPFLPAAMVCDILGCDIRDFRKLCVVYDIPLHADPVFGELMGIAAFHRFFTALHHFRDPARFDRQALIAVLHNSYTGPDKAIRVLPFDRRLDMEIRRIAKLEEPMRFERSMALMEAMEDAKDVADCLARYKSEEPALIPAMEKLQKVINASVGLPNESPSTPSPNPRHPEE